MTDQKTEELLLQLEAHRRRLAILETQVAMHGTAYAPPAQISGIDEARSAIAQILAVLRQRGFSQDQTPEIHTTQATPTVPTSAAQIGQAEIGGVVSLPGANFSGAQHIQIIGVQIGAHRPLPKQPPEDSSK